MDPNKRVEPHKSSLDNVSKSVVSKGVVSSIYIAQYQVLSHITDPYGFVPSSRIISFPRILP